MIKYIVVIIVLILIGILCFSSFSFTKVRKKIDKKNISVKPISLAEKLEILNGQNKRSFIKKEMYEVKVILKNMGRESYYTTIQLQAILLAGLGAIIGVAIKNYFLIPVLMVLFAMIPFFRIKSLAEKYKKIIDDELESTTSLITTSYLRNDNFIVCVQENLPYLHPSIAPFFKEFLVEATLVNANTISSINNLKLKIDNPIFHKWCDCVIVCQEDRALKPTLLPIVEEFSLKRVIQIELDAEANAPKKDAYVMMILTVAMMPFMYLINKDWGMMLLTHPIGKITIAVVAAVLVGVFFAVKRLSKPVEFRGESDEY